MQQVWFVYCWYFPIHLNQFIALASLRKTDVVEVLKMFRPNQLIKNISTLSQRKHVKLDENIFSLNKTIKKHSQLVKQNNFSSAKEKFTNITP